MHTFRDDHPKIETGKIGVLLINLGTPDATDYWSIRRYLSEFLSDPRVIEINPMKWQPLLQGIILSVRPHRSARAYQAIWNKEKNESPLRTTTRNQAALLGPRLAARDKRVATDWAMRYGTPSIASRIKALVKEGCERVLLAPLYPQYAASTTATANDKAFDALKTMRWQPAVRTLPPYFGERAYIDALAASLKTHLGTLDWKPDVVLASFHGLPREYLDKGDPYHCHCHKTARLLREKLKWDDDFLLLSFQSRFGRAEWITPYTDETLARLAEEGVERIVVITPGFSVDCLETLEEIALGGRDIFLNRGGKAFSLVPCLNDSKPGMEMIESLVLKELKGWI